MYLQIIIYIFCQDGSEVPVAVKTCKVENEESMTEKFLEEACEYQTAGVTSLSSICQHADTT